MGLPLTIEPHDCHQKSFLNNDDIQLKGLVNLLVLLLITYHLRGIVDNIAENNFVLYEKVIEFWNSGVLFDPANYITGLASLTISQFAVYAFVIEKLAAKNFVKV